MDAAEQLFLTDDDQALHQLMQEMQQRIAEICDRIETGTATVSDANYIRAEYGINTRKDKQ